MSPRILIFLGRQRAHCLSTGCARARSPNLAWNSADSAPFSAANRGKCINGLIRRRNGPDDGWSVREAAAICGIPGMICGAVLIAGGDHQQAKAKNVGKRIRDERRMGRIAQATRQPLGDAQFLFDLAQQQNAAVRG